jgi:hypothetical protein
MFFGLSFALVNHVERLPEYNYVQCESEWRARNRFSYRAVYGYPYVDSDGA